MFSAPDSPRNFHDALQFGPLFVVSKQIAFLGAGEAALRAEAKLVEIQIL